MFFNSKYSQQVPLINSNLYVFRLICIAKSNSSRIFALSKKLRNEREILCAAGKTVFLLFLLLLYLVNGVKGSLKAGFYFIYGCN